MLKRIDSDEEGNQSTQSKSESQGEIDWKEAQKLWSEQ